MCECEKKKKGGFHTIKKKSKSCFQSLKFGTFLGGDAELPVVFAARSRGRSRKPLSWARATLRWQRDATRWRQSSASAPQLATHLDGLSRRQNGAKLVVGGGGGGGRRGFGLSTVMRVEKKKWQFSGEPRPSSFVFGGVVWSREDVQRRPADDVQASLMVLTGKVGTVTMVTAAWPTSWGWGASTAVAFPSAAACWLSAPPPPPA